MSPEQVLSQPVDGRSDLFSLGVILYELATGKRPFQGENLAAMFRMITGEEPPEPITLNPAMPRELSRDIMKCLAKDPEQRFATGRELAEALRRSVQIARPTPGPVPAPKPARRGLISSLAAVLLAGIIGFAVYHYIIKPKPAPVVVTTEPPKTDLQSGTTATTKPPPEPPPPIPPPKLGGLKIETTPTGAQVLVDGENKGITPLNIQVPPGAHEVRLVLADYGDWEAQVKVVEDKVTHIPVELMPLEEKQ